MPSDDYESRIASCLSTLGIPHELIRDRSLPLHAEAVELEIVAVGIDGREHRLMPAAACPWRDLQMAAASADVSLTVVSAYRSIERQAEIIRGKIAAGLPFDVIFCASAPPGYSEHHTGRAIDVTTPGVEPLHEAFEDTVAFAWLSENAGKFCFSRSYPRNNQYGFMYEPWHWCYGRPEV